MQSKVIPVLVTYSSFWNWN